MKNDLKDKQYWLLEDPYRQSITLGFKDKEKLDKYFEKNYHSNPEARRKVHVVEFSEYESLLEKIKILEDKLKEK